MIRLTLTCLLAEGHRLLEDLPGTGKTMLARALANTVEVSHARMPGRAVLRRLSSFLACDGREDAIIETLLRVKALLSSLRGNSFAR